MRIVRAVNATRQAVLAEQVALADSFLSRGWGLLGHSCLRPGQGMLITNTNCVHTFFMRFAIDTVYVDRDGLVCGIARILSPFRIGPFVWRARQVLELPAGTIDCTATELGDRIVFENT